LVRGSPRLGEAARVAFDEAVSGIGRVVVPAIVLAEMVMLLEKRRAPIEIDRVVAELRSAPGFALKALKPEVVLRIKDLTAIPDIHDRLIVAEALSAGATVITRDRKIIRSGLVPTIW
jgi:predicted nucleic acid-binding protein